MAMEYGYALSAEEHSPPDLVRHAGAAERAGFGFGLISDHIHPWVDAQGHSAFVWSVLGGIAQAPNRLRIGTGVTCPMIRIHPAIIAHAAATVACLMPGRFFLGVGTGENLNEHVLGSKWPAPDERLAMLQEAVEVIRLLWQGGYQTHRGKHYTVENLRIFDLPDEPIEVAVAAMQPQVAKLAGRIGDSLVNVAPKKEIVEKFEEGGGNGKPKYGQITVCYAKSKDNAKKTAFEVWPNALVEGSSSQELPLPSDFEQLVRRREADELEGTLTLGPDADEYVDKVKEYDKAGYTHVYFHQVGPDQNAFLAFAQNELLPRL
jgi:coenzyme F420-dependent glucose-6-phosphate dehydrogenase